MNFLYPLGLLALIAIPVLIIIYIIKNKYTEQVIASTYLWTLSEKFLKRKNPLKRITGLLSLILQILIVVAIAFSIAQPSFTLVNAAEDYLFVLDGSASMNITRTDGSTRLEEGISRIEKIVRSSTDGSTYTIIYAADTVTTMCSESADKDTVYKVLDKIEAGYCGSNLTAALSVAQESFDANSSLKIYLFSDKDFQTADSNFTVVNLASSGEENYSLSDVSYAISGEQLVVKGNLWSYESDADITVSLYVDGLAEAEDTATVQVTKLEATTFSLASSITGFSTFTVKITNGDSFADDNEYTVYSEVSGSTYSTLIVTDASSSVDNSFFIQSILKSFGDIEVETVTSLVYEKGTSVYTGYGLYIFDGCTPASMPVDGAVWFINPDQSVSNTGFTVTNSYTYPDSSHGILTYSTSTNSRVQTLLSGTIGANIYVKSYVKCSTGSTLYPLLYCGSDPVVFAGTNGAGNREAVFAFDFHDTNFTVSADYVQLMYNIFCYTFPEIVPEGTYYCGDTIQINVPASCDSIEVHTPQGNVDYADNTTDIAEYDVTEAGTYTIILKVSGSERQVKLFVSVPLEERYTSATVTADGSVYVNDGTGETAVLTADGAATEVPFTINGTLTSGTRDGYFDKLWVWLLALAILFIADWGVYCYEQYQLR